MARGSLEGDGVDRSLKTADPATRRPGSLSDPDYSTVFVTRQSAADPDTIDQIVQTAVGLGEVLAGLGDDDVRLRDGVLAVIRAD